MTAFTPVRAEIMQNNFTRPMFNQTEMVRATKGISSKFIFFLTQYSIYFGIFMCGVVVFIMFARCALKLYNAIRNFRYKPCPTYDDSVRQFDAFEPFKIIARSNPECVDPSSYRKRIFRHPTLCDLPSIPPSTITSFPSQEIDWNASFLENRNYCSCSNCSCSNRPCTEEDRVYYDACNMSDNSTFINFYDEVPPTLYERRKSRRYDSSTNIYDTVTPDQTTTVAEVHAVPDD